MKMKESPLVVHTSSTQKELYSTWESTTLALDVMLEKHATADESKTANGKEEEEVAKKPSGFGGNEEMDPDELAMLGIDPSDFDGFGK